MIGAVLSGVQCILLVYVASFLFRRAGNALLFYVIGLLVVRIQFLFIYLKQMMSRLV